MLATLGILFTKAGVGVAVGMAVFTVIMGNAFAAFPTMTAAIGWPVLVQHFGGNPAPIFAIGMLCGFSAEPS